MRLTEEEYLAYRAALVQLELGKAVVTVTIGSHSTDFVKANQDWLQRRVSEYENPTFSPRSYAKNGGRG